MNNKMMNFFKKIAKLSSRYGYEIIPNWRIDHVLHSRLISEIFGKNSINTVLDVGANKGQYMDFLRKQVGYEGVIHSFEPVLSNYAELRKNTLHDKNLFVHNYALGKESCEKEINVMKVDVFTSFLDPTDQYIKDFENQNTIARTEKVVVRRLDEVLCEIGCFPKNNPTYLKIDTQGFDIQVIEGLGESISEIRALQTEVSVINIYDGMPSMFSSIDLINKFGFELAGLFSVNRDKNLRVIEFDAVFVNKRYFVQ